MSPALTLSAAQFYTWLEQELAESAAHLPPSSQAELRHYYRSLVSQQRSIFARYNWLRRTGPLHRYILSLPPRSQPWRVLDAGCGLGTEAYSIGSLREDVEVLGVDISPERLALAEKRRPFYNQQAGRALSVRFQDRDIFQVLEAGRFDLIWSMEAISHIDPAERFLQAAASALDPGGCLVISDSNRTNPYMLWRIYRLRKHVQAYGKKTLSTGEIIGYAHERLFSVPELTALLRQAGFGRVESQLSVFFPPAFARLGRLYPALDAAFNAIPLLRQMGGIYTITASKAA